MPDRLTIAVAPDIREKLAELSQRTKRSESDIAADAVTAFINDELAEIAAIERGLADVAAGRVVEQDAAMRELAEIIESAKRKAS